MYRHIRLIRQICGGRQLHRLAMTVTVIALTLGLMTALPPIMVGYSRHRAWKDSGLQNVAFFTSNERFQWDSAGAPPSPAYDELRAFLDAMPGCTSAAVDYYDTCLEGIEDRVSLFLYPEALNRAVKTPLSEGTMETVQFSSNALPVVLDSRLKGRYCIGDRFMLTYAEYSWYDFDQQVPAVVTGFLLSDNDHLSTLGGSNARRLKFFANKAAVDDPLVIVAVEHPLLEIDKPYTGGKTSTFLLADEGEKVDDFIHIWRKEIEPLNLGQIDSYRQMHDGDIKDCVIDNIDFAMLSAWALALMLIGIFGESLMQIELWKRRLSVMSIIGMSPSKMIAYLTIGGYGSLVLANVIGLGLGLAVAIPTYSGDHLVVVLTPLILIVLGFTMLPGLIAFVIEVIQVLRMGPIQNWNQRR